MLRRVKSLFYSVPVREGAIATELLNYPRSTVLKRLELNIYSQYTIPVEMPAQIQFVCLQILYYSEMFAGEKDESHKIV